MIAARIRALVLFLVAGYLVWKYGPRSLSDEATAGLVLFTCAAYFQGIAAGYEKCLLHMAINSIRHTADNNAPKPPDETIPPAPSE